MDPSHQIPLLPIEARKVARLLGFSGVIPFLALLVFSLWDGFAWAHTPLIVYAMLILAFMAGAHWFALISAQRSSSRPTLELVATNALVLSAWPAVAMPMAWACLWLGCLFLGHLALDSPWRSVAGPAWYRHMRLGLSAMVITSLLLAGLIGLGLSFNAT